MIALFASVKANPGFVYTVGHGAPLIYTNGHSGHQFVASNEPVQPLQYVRPTLYANNACRNNLGELVPCAFPSVAGSSVYAYNTVPDLGFVQATGGVANVIGEAQPEDSDVPEAPSVDVRQGLTKREAEADPHTIYAYPHYGYYRFAAPYSYHFGYAPYGCRNGYGSLVPCA